ncbi:hypothetical protein D3C87_158620 [compost metagenome]
MKLFKERDINEYFKLIFDKINSDIENMNEDKFMEYNSEELSKNKSEASKLNHLKVDLSKRTSSVTMVKIEGKKFPPLYDVDRGKSHSCARIDYSYDLPKESELLAFRPTKFHMTQRIEATINKDKLILHHQTLYGNENLPEVETSKVKNSMTLVHEDINRNVEYINLEIDVFNNKIEELILKIINDRRDRINRSRDQNNDLNDF